MTADTSKGPRKSYGKNRHRPLPEQRNAASQVEQFTRYFALLLARTDRQRRETFKIRGDVYGKEFGFEPLENCPGGLEQDEFDERATHCLIRHRQQELPAGCVRLVTVPEDQPDRLLPLEECCAESLFHADLRPDCLPRHSLIEISRLAVHTLFRRRVGEQASPMGMHGSAEFGDEERRVFPVIAQVLSFASIAMAELLDRHHMFAMMEPKLARRLQRIGINFVRIGDVMEYHGPRAAYYLPTRQGAQGASEAVPGLYGLIRATLSEQLQAGQR